MSAPTAPARSGRRRVLLAGLAAVVVLAALAGWLVLRPSADGGSATAAPATTTLPAPGSYGTSVLDESATAAPDDVPGAVLATVPGRPEALAPVPLAEPVEYGDGLSARLVDIKAITAEARGVGETSGPALVVIVELTNTAEAPVALDTVAVNMFLGADGAPAARLVGDSGAPFSGSLEPGASAQAVYAFTVPVDRRDVVTVTVGVTPDAGTAVFSGSVA
ncbi:hypothetical protein [Geodermatophilus sp. SYSU D00815]